MMYVPYQQILDQINTLEKGDIVYLISDVLDLAKVCRLNGERFEAEKFLKTIMNKIGKEGTLLIPVFNWDFCQGIAFDYCNTKGKTGALGNCVLKNAEFKRTKHPIYSFMIWGKKQKELVSVEQEDCFGSGSIFDFLYKNNAKAFVIGLNALEGLTMMHYVEQKIGVPYRYFKSFEGKYIDEVGIEDTKKVTMYVRDLEINPEEDTQQLSEIIEKLNISTTKMVNGIPFRTVRLKQACQIIQIDIELNNSHNLYRFEERG